MREHECYLSVDTKTDGSYYLHRDGILRRGANDNGIDHDFMGAWYASREDAQKVKDVYMNKFKTKGEEVETRQIKDYYVSFTKDMLKRFNFADPDRTLLNIETYSEEDVLEKLKEYIGEGRVHYAIYEGYDARIVISP